MSNIIVYYSSVAELLTAQGYREGYSCICTIPDHKCKVSFWCKGVDIVAVEYIGGIVSTIRDCNTGIQACASVTTYDAFLSKVKEALSTTTGTPPSILSIMENVLYEPNVDRTVKIVRVAEVVPHMSSDMIGLFQTELHELLGDTAAPVSQPKQFQLYREIASGNVYCLSELQGSVSIMRNLRTSATNYKIVDFQHLYGQYVLLEDQSDVRQLLILCLNDLHEITNVSELIDTLQSIGCTGLDGLSKVSQPVFFESPDTTIQLSTGFVSGNIAYNINDWIIGIETGPILGSVSIRHTSDHSDYYETVSSIRDIVKPSLLLSFVVTFYSSLLKSADFIMNDMLGLRSYMSGVLHALDYVEAPHILPDVTWHQVRYPSFDPVVYMSNTYHIDTRRLPEAALMDCKTPEDCAALYNQLKEFL